MGYRLAFETNRSPQQVFDLPIHEVAKQWAIVNGSSRDAGG